MTTPRLRAGSRLRSIVSLILAASACRMLPDRQFEKIGDSLKLKLVKIERSESGPSAKFVFTLANGGPDAVSACLGPGRSVSYQTSGYGGTSFTWIDHPGCVREFTITPAGEMTWSEVLEVPNVSEGRGSFEVAVEVVNPRRCDGAGCTSIRLTSDKQTIQ